MIYIIDDKMKRQREDFGWSEDKMNRYASIIQPIHSLEDLKERSKELFQEGNIVVYHESFLDSTSKSDQALEKRGSLVNYAQNHQNFHLAIFSGSKASRRIDENVAHLPVSVVYQNLGVLARKASQGETSLLYLLFGKNPEIENKLLDHLKHALLNLDNKPAKIEMLENIFFRPAASNIQEPIESTDEETLFGNVSDEKMSQIIDSRLSLKNYDNIFVPLCFGETLSDFNGLRFATHIRCTESPNQLKNIFIYGFVGAEYLLDNEYLHILNTRNVFLVSYDKQEFQEKANILYEPLKIGELPREMGKLKLDPPNNYNDSHSIANEWAIYQWCKLIYPDEDEGLLKVTSNVHSNLYFKYLRTINPVSRISAVPDEHLKIVYSGDPKVLLIDDETDKGWHEMFSYLLGDRNDVYLDSIGEEFIRFSREEIIDQSIKKIVNDDIDVVILDFRLNTEDFDNSNIDEVSSILLLKEIKKVNPGIQVMIFSATNKVWNLQALQDAGADGFILKESPENSVDPDFTLKSIKLFMHKLEDMFGRIYLKAFYRSIFKIEQNLGDCDYEDDSGYEGFILDLKSQIKIIGQSGRSINRNTSTSLDVVFLNCYNFLEKFKSYYIIERNYNFYLGIREIAIHRYEYSKGSIIDKGKFIRESSSDSPSWFQCMAGLFLDYFDVVENGDQSIKDLWNVKSWRNNYIHEKKVSFNQSELVKITNLMIKITSAMKE